MFEVLDKNLYISNMALSIRQAAKKLGVSARRVNQLIDERKLKAEKVDSYYVIQEEDLKSVTIYGKPGRPKKRKP